MMTLLSHSMTLHILFFHKNFAMSANLMLMTLLRHSHLWKQITSQDLQDHIAGIVVRPSWLRSFK